MIQFNGVSCGPCKTAIPFLRVLSNVYDIKDFDFAAIECICISSHAIKSCMERIKFDYKFLLSTKDVLKDYSIRSFPVFFILDKNRIVRQVINGYGEVTTDNTIKTIIRELIE